MYAQVALTVSIKIDLLWYSVPEELKTLLTAGDIVLVPLRGKIVDGVVFKVFDQCPLKKSPLPIHKKMNLPHLPQDTLALAEFASKYYLVPLHQPMKLFLPQRAVKENPQRIYLRHNSKLDVFQNGLSMEALFTLSILQKSAQKSLLWQTIVRRMKLDSQSILAEQILLELRNLPQISIEENPPLISQATLEEKQILHHSTDDLAIGHSGHPKNLSFEQKTVLETLLSALQLLQDKQADIPAKETNFLLHGVTGSGKTEIYLRLIEQILAKGKTALVLVPEIGLTPQLLSIFRYRFGDQIAVIHSSLTPQQRFDNWNKIANQQIRIVLGARSALFAPLKNLGLIIIDEEHDSSFKQQDGFRYHAKDLALVRALYARALIVLGSATPSLESWQLLQQEKMTLLTMKHRPAAIQLPNVQLVDLKEHSLGTLLLSPPLIHAIQQNLQQHKQTILFLNRRGYASFILCKSCGHKLECPHCAVTLTWHKNSHSLICHYCAHRVQFQPDNVPCPKCHNHLLSPLGMGTQKIEEQVSRLFPSAKIARIDKDNAKDLTRILAAMHKKEIDILIGTQMIAKGHDFSQVCLVGVILADTSLGLPDFRASEKTFQLLMQVAGRSGRTNDKGQVIIQTYVPNHHALYFSAHQDYNGFVQKELSFRKELLYPPYTKMVLIRIDGRELQDTESIAKQISQMTQNMIRTKNLPCDTLGPVIAPISKLKGQIRFQFFLKSSSAKVLHQIGKLISDTFVAQPLVRVSIDFDPVSVL